MAICMSAHVTGILSCELLKELSPERENGFNGPSAPQEGAGATVMVLTLCLDGVGVDGGVGPAGGPPRLQDVLADTAGDAGQLGGLQDEGLAVLGQQLGSTLVAGEWRHALHLLPGHVTARPRFL